MTSRIFPTAGAVALAGRAIEQQVFAECLGRLRPGERTQRLAVHGEPGLGKTRLLEGFRSRCAADALGWFGTTAAEADRHVPYRVWRSLVSGMLPALAARWHQTVSQTAGPRPEGRLLQALFDQGEDAVRQRELLPVLGDLLVTGLPETARSQALSPEGRADALADLVADLVGRAAGETGLVLAIDDTHWMDSASWRLLERVCTRTSGLLVVLGLQTLTSASDRLLRDEGTINRVLGPLGDADLERLLEPVLGNVPPSQALREAIGEASSGFPLHAVELVRLLLERGQIVVRDGRACLAAGNRLDPVPGVSRADDLSGLLAARLQRLSAPERDLLLAASVAHGPFTAQWLALVGGTDAAAVRAPLAACIERALIEPEAGGMTYRFRHGYLRRAVATAADPVRHRALHAAAACVAEASARAGADTVAARIADHWRCAGEAWRAADWLRTAGREAMQRHAHAEAVVHLGEAIEGLQSDGGAFPGIERDRVDQARVECLRRLGYSQLQLGDLAAAQRDLSAALDLAGHRVPLSRSRQLASAVLDTLVLGLRMPSASRRDRAASVEERGVAVALIRLTHIAYLRVDTPLLTWASLRCLRVVGRFSPGRESAIIDAAIATGCGALGLHRSALRRAERAIEAARGIGDPATLVQVLLFSAMYRANASGGERAVVDALEAYRLARRVGDGRRASECALVLGLLRSRAGAREAGRRWYVRLCRIAQARADAQSLGWGRLGLARAALAAGDVHEARRHLEGVPVPASDGLADIERAGLLSAVMLAEGDPGAGAAASLTLRMLRERLPVSFGIVGGARAALDTHVALVALASAEAAKAPGREARSRLRDVLAQARRALAAFAVYARQVQVARPALLIARGRIAALAGQSRRAQGLWRAAAGEAEQLALPVDRDLAQSLIDEGAGGAGSATAVR
jgi:hypothetical protein